MNAAHDSLGAESSFAVLADRVDAVLPQTQCTRCGFPDCRGYAEAIARGEAPIDRCPPGGAEGIARLSFVTGTPAQPLDESCGREGPLQHAVIDEGSCIGCTLCIKACPVDCIIGAPKLMHTVIDDLCTGCELCIPVCPVDCISLIAVSGDRTGWAAWSSAQAGEARARYAFHRQRLAREQRENDERLAARAVGKASDPASDDTLCDPEGASARPADIDGARMRTAARRAGP